MMRQFEAVAIAGGAAAPAVELAPGASTRNYAVALFVLLSLLFGGTVLTITAPLRGPDEPSHLLRAYGVLRGEIVPSTTDNNGRKGILLPAELYRQMQLYETALGGMYRGPGRQATVVEVLAEYGRL